MFGDEISETLRQNGMNPSAVLSRAALPVDKIRPLEGWHAEGDPVHAENLMNEFGLAFSRILVVDMGDHYQTIDGEHRVKATKMAGARTIDAYVLEKRAFDVLFPKYGENELSNWAESQWPR